MDVFAPFLLFAIRGLAVLLPLSVGLLAFRRLALSKTDNAWIYAASCLFAAVTVAGVLPWMLGLAEVNRVLAAFALSSPVLWIGVVMLCERPHPGRYGDDPFASPAERFIDRTRARLSATKRALEDRQEGAVPVFRHTRAPAEPAPTVPAQTSTARTLLELARDIRGNRSSERRRPKLLPPPESHDLPFLRSSGDA